MTRTALAISVSLVAISSVAFAATPARRTDPGPYIAKPCAGDDRMLCVNYQADRTLQIPVTPGATLVMSFPPGESPQTGGILASDQSILANEAPDDQNAQVADASGGIIGGQTRQQSAGSNPSCDANLCRSIIGNKVYLKPVRDLAPQPLFVQTEYCDGGSCDDIVYPLEIVTRPADLNSGAMKGMFGIKFMHPGRVSAASRKMAEERWKHQQELKAMAPPPPSVPTDTTNQKYAFRGKGQAAALAADEIWDDGRTTFMRYKGNRQIPVPYTYLADGSPTKLNYVAEPGPDETILRIAGVRSKFCVASGVSGCVYNVPLWMAEHGMAVPNDGPAPVVAANRPVQ